MKLNTILNNIKMNLVDFSKELKKEIKMTDLKIENVIFNYYIFMLLTH